MTCVNIKAKVSKYSQIIDNEGVWDGLFCCNVDTNIIRQQKLESIENNGKLRFLNS